MHYSMNSKILRMILNAPIKIYLFWSDIKNLQSFDSHLALQFQKFYFLSSLSVIPGRLILNADLHSNLS